MAYEVTILPIIEDSFSVSVNIVGGGGGSAPEDHTHLADDITDFETAVSANSSVTANTAKRSYPIEDETKLGGIASGANNYSHPNHTGDVSSDGDGNTIISSGVVSNAKLANVPTSTIKGRNTAGTGDPEDLSIETVQEMLEMVDTNVSQFAVDSEGDAVIRSLFIPFTGNVISFNVSGNTLGSIAEPNTSTEIAPTVENARNPNQCIVYSKAASQPSYTVGILKGDNYSLGPNDVNILTFTYHADNAITVRNEVVSINSASIYNYFLNQIILAYLMTSNASNVMVDELELLNGTTSNITVGSDAEGSYYDFNGTDSIATVTHDEALSVTTEFTFMVDVYPDSTSGGSTYRAIFSKPREGITSQHYSLLMTENNMSLFFRLKIDANTRDWPISGGIMQANKWNRIIGRYKSGEARKIWIKPIDAAVTVLTEGTVYSGSITDEETPLVFGNMSDNPAYQQGWYNGRMKNFHTWSTAITDDDIGLLISEDLSYPDFE